MKLLSNEFKRIYAIFKIRPATYNVSKEYKMEEIGQWYKGKGFEIMKRQKFGFVRNRRNLFKMNFYGGLVV